MLRDFQRKKVYDAEQASILIHEHGYHVIATVREIEEIHNLFTRSSMYAPVLQVPIPFTIANLPKNSGAIADQSAGKIYFDPECISPAIYCHELAHIICARKHGWWRTPFHGPRFTFIYLNVVREILGNHAHDILREAFEKFDVKLLGEE